MIPRRRSRFVLIAAVIVTILLYNAWDSSSSLSAHAGLPHNLAPASAPGPAAPVAAPQNIKNDGLKSVPPPPAAPAPVPAAQVPVQPSYKETAEKTHPHSPSYPDPAAGAASPKGNTKSSGNTLEIPTLKDAASSDHHVDLSLPETAAESHHQGLMYDPITGTSKGVLPEAIPDLHERPPPPSAAIKPAAATTKIHWSKVPEHFPVPTESIIHMPTGTPKAIPKIQFNFPKTEDATAKAKRLERQKAVVDEMKHAWTGYRTYAWMHDELAPNTKEFKDPFCGWAATLVDSLDTLWIMGLTDEFDEAAKAVRDIDFTYTPQRRDIPVFETIIRYLGGLLSAYDVSGGAKGNYPMLLEKAIELAEILMGVFDTPNRMPILYYQWQPEAASQPHRAGSVGVAELGSMSMEFTRLAQLTGKQKYYDAIARITNEFEGLQDRGTALDGLFPEHLDASGCNHTATAERNRLAAQQEKPPVGFQPQGQAESSTGTELHKRSPLGLARERNQFYQSGNWDCVPQPLIPSSSSGQSYSLGGSQDSTYEYFPKQFLLLGGLEPKYKKMHRKVMEGAKKYLLYRPMINDTREVLFTGKAMTLGTDNARYRLEYEVTHLSCFVGGMFGMGAKIFNDPEDLDIAIQLTEGCVWSYNSTPTGIMPESAQVVACEDLNVCAWNESKWWETLDGSGDWRNKQVAIWESKKAMFLETYVPKLPVQTATPAIDDTTDAAAAAVPTVSIMPTQAPAGDLSSVESVPKNNASAPIGARSYNKPTATTNTLAEPVDPAVVLAKGLGLALGEYDYETMKAMMDQIGRRPLNYTEAVLDKLARHNIPPGYTMVNGKRYILRPEAIESVWYMYRITGDPSWMDKGWTMWQAIISHVKTEFGHSALDNILDPQPEQLNGMESFWTAETLKYFYLLFSEPDVINLDEWVLNTEAHPFKRPTAPFGNGEQAVKL
ncbi:hypothetical protein TD95_000260 [Thielaviopsis punctulata]|uniref:alpha-1,2-Mannosidase n=1 Tax=Thielaviopsis punctulata TaxID=72032 RepID=A0A0F4ZF55_9PEZI|nr:hypothetical protein TD95_000260 [Thielaviopsis punctulata]